MICRLWISNKEITGGKKHENKTNFHAGSNDDRRGFGGLCDRTKKDNRGIADGTARRTTADGFEAIR
jgi:hypothetical protein